MSIHHYTGFTTRCKKCNQDVRSKYQGKTPEGVPRYLLVCGCKRKENKMSYYGCGSANCPNNQGGLGNDSLCKCMMRVVIESPYAGESENQIKVNEIYGEFCMRDCIVNYNETPYASHLLYTRKYVLKDKDPVQRKLGIEAGFFWRDVSTKTVFYVDLGMTPGMNLGIDDCEKKGNKYEVRHIHPDLWGEFIVALGAEGLNEYVK